MIMGCKFNILVIFFVILLIVFGVSVVDFVVNIVEIVINVGIGYDDYDMMMIMFSGFI